MARRQVGDSRERALLVRGERVRQHRPEQVRPPDRADQQAAAGEDGARHVGILAGRARLGHEPGEVLRRVAGRRPGRQPEPADLQPVALVRRPVLELVAAAPRRDDLRTGRGPGLQRPGQVVVVDVRLEDVPDTPAAPLRDLEEAPRVALRIDEDRVAPAGQQVRAVAEAGRHEDLEIERPLLLHPDHRDTPWEDRLVPCARWRRSATRRCSSSSTRTSCSTGASRRRRPASTPGSWSPSTSTRGRPSRARRRSPGRSWARSGCGHRSGSGRPSRSRASAITPRSWPTPRRRSARCSPAGSGSGSAPARP